MNTREKQLEYCTVCTKRKFDPQKGLVCSLTGQWADFENECPDIEIDEAAKIREENSKKRREEDALKSETGGLHVIGIKNGGVAGLIILILGLTWLIGGIVFMNLIFFYSFAVIVFGIGILVTHFVKIYNKKKKQNFIQKNDDVLDLENEQ